MVASLFSFLFRKPVANNFSTFRSQRVFYTALKLLFGLIVLIFSAVFFGFLGSSFIGFYLAAALLLPVICLLLYWPYLSSKDIPRWIHILNVGCMGLLITPSSVIEGSRIFYSVLILLLNIELGWILFFKVLKDFRENARFFLCVSVLLFSLAGLQLYAIQVNYVNWP